MPYKWVEPEVFLQHGGVTVYRAYDDDRYDSPLEFWYNTEPCDTEFEFDVRELRQKLSKEAVRRVLDMIPPNGKQADSHRAVITVAIEEGLLL